MNQRDCGAAVHPRQLQINSLPATSPALTCCNTLCHRSQSSSEFLPLGVVRRRVRTEGVCGLDVAIAMLCNWQVCSHPVSVTQTLRLPAAECLWDNNRQHENTRWDDRIVPRWQTHQNQTVCRKTFTNKHVVYYITYTVDFYTRRLNNISKWSKKGFRKNCSPVLPPLNCYCNTTSLFFSHWKSRSYIRFCACKWWLAMIVSLNWIGFKWLMNFNPIITFWKAWNLITQFMRWFC